ncbi:MAG: ribosomal-processing cysteine protease Prp [Butyrivibrio sp.]|nr:ribosomal-processing cysteine protease Prp [Butyrivibrio sp.]
MTNIVILKNSKDQYKGFKMNGHAGFADYGKDIVCSALSVLSINTINSIDQFTDDMIEVDQDSDSGELKMFFLNEPSANSVLLMKSFELGITSIYKQYGKKFLNIKFEEV